MKEVIEKLEKINGKIYSLQNWMIAYKEDPQYLSELLKEVENLIELK